MSLEAWLPSRGGSKTILTRMGLQALQSTCPKLGLAPRAPMSGRKEAVVEEMGLTCQDCMRPKCITYNWGNCVLALCWSSSSLLKTLDLESTMVFPELATERKTKQNKKTPTL